MPVDSAAPIVDRTSSVDKQLVVQGGGHVGAVVSRKASDRRWPIMSKFWAIRAA